jgi:hypothetical protein
MQDDEKTDIDSEFSFDEYEYSFERIKHKFFSVVLDSNAVDIIVFPVLANVSASHCACAPVCHQLHHHGV